MAYCPNCGEPLGDSPRTPEAEDAAVKIARMECERDIEIARINAGVARREAEAVVEVTAMETEAQVESAAAEAVVTSTILGAAVPDGGDAPTVEVVDAPEGGDAEVVDDTAAPPVLEATEGSQPPEPEKKRGIGMWSST